MLIPTVAISTDRCPKQSMDHDHPYNYFLFHSSISYHLTSPVEDNFQNSSLFRYSGRSSCSQGDDRHGHLRRLSRLLRPSTTTLLDNPCWTRYSKGINSGRVADSEFNRSPKYNFPIVGDNHTHMHASAHTCTHGSARFGFAEASRTTAQGYEERVATSVPSTVCCRGGSKRGYVVTSDITHIHASCALSWLKYVGPQHRVMKTE